MKNSEFPYFYFQPQISFIKIFFFFVFFFVETAKTELRSALLPDINFQKCLLLYYKIEYQYNRKPRRKNPISRPDASCHEAKKLDDVTSDVPLHDWIPETWLARSIWPQNALLQACYSRNFNLKPTLLWITAHCKLHMRYKPKFCCILFYSFVSTGIQSWKNHYITSFS